MQPTVSTFTPPWANDSFSSLRQSAREAFLGFPHRKIENWKYTDLNRFWSGKTLTPIKDRVMLEVSPKAAPNAKRVTFVNGEFAPEYSDLDALPNGLSVESISTEELGLLTKHTEGLKASEHPMAFLNLSLLSDGVVVRVKANTIIEDPLHFIYIAHSQEANTFVNLCQVLILEANAELKIIEEVRGDALEAPQIINSLSLIELGDGARAEHVLIQSQNNHLSHIAGVHVNQSKDSHLFSFAASLGCALSRYDFHSKLQGPGAKCILDGLYMLSGQEHADIHTRVDHLASHTQSEQIYIGVMDGRSHGVFNGKAVAHAGNTHIAAHQINRNLLLSKLAQVDSKPDLEIYTDDVKCSHGATVGQLDENALFYLQSRGISKQEAKHLLTQAFIKQALLRLSSSLTAWLEQILADRIELNLGKKG